MARISKAVILDVDGVVFCHRPTLHKVNTNIVKYVDKATRLTEPTAERVNQKLYMHFGHTYTGLQKVYGIKANLQSFNDYVYTQDIIRGIDNSTYNVDILHHLIDLQSFLQRCSVRNVPVYLFSNAPSSWCKEIHRVYNLRNWIPEENIFTCEHDIFQSSLKPNQLVYKTLQTYLSHHHQNSDLQLVFVDDSLSNLLPVMDAPRWRTVLFGADHPSFGTDKITQITSFKELQI